MRYVSVCSGIEAATVAWEPLGWEPVWFAEVAPFPSRVLAHHYPSVPNLGDFTGVRGHWLRRIGIEPRAVDLVVAGTPCQSFSDAGPRTGLADPRGNLALEFARLVGRLLPRWVVWENVRGVLSSQGGRAFGTILGALAELGYGFAYRVLDAQYFGVPQRRRRVFVVGHSGGAWQRAAAVLFESACVPGDPPARGAAWSDVADALTASAGGRGGDVADGRAGHLIANTVTAHHDRNDPETETLVVPLQDTLRSRSAVQHGIGIGEAGAPSYTLGTNDGHGVVAFHGNQDPVSSGVCPSLGAHTDQMAVAVFDEQQITHPENRARCLPGDPCPTLAKQSRPAVITEGEVRRLTPRERERLQGFPDDYTLIPGASDTARNTAIGNSMAVPVMRWIGERIALVDALAPVEATA